MYTTAMFEVVESVVMFYFDHTSTASLGAKNICPCNVVADNNLSFGMLRGNQIVACSLNDGKR